MTPLQYLKKHGKKRAEEVAALAGTNYDYYWQIAHHYRNASSRLARRLVGASGGQIDFESLVFSTDKRK